MSTVAKILIVVNLIFAAAFLMSAANFLGQQDLWKARYDKAEQEHVEALGRKEQALQAKTREAADNLLQFNEAQAKLQTAQAQLTAAQAQNDMLREGYNQISVALGQATASLEKAQDTLRSNREMIDSLQSERTMLADAKRQALDQKDAAVRVLSEKEIQFENLLAQKQGLESRIEDLTNQLRSAQLTTEVAVNRMGGSDEVPMDQPAHSGQILSVDVEHNVAVLSLGAEDGVRPGFRYLVSRGSDYVTTLEITDVQARQSAGRSVVSLQKSPIRRGDRVTSR